MVVVGFRGALSDIVAIWATVCARTHLDCPEVDARRGGGGNDNRLAEIRELGRGGRRNSLPSCIADGDLDAARTGRCNATMHFGKCRVKHAS